MADGYSYTCFVPLLVGESVTQMLLTQSKWFNNSCETERGKKDMVGGGGSGGKSGKKEQSVKYNSVELRPFPRFLFCTLLSK